MDVFWTYFGRILDIFWTFFGNFSLTPFKPAVSSLALLAKDRVKNVRSAVARVIGILRHVELFQSDESFMGVWRNLSEDSDAVVRDVLKQMSPEDETQ